MNTAEKRQHLHQRIDELDDKFLRVLHAMVEAYVTEQEEVVGYEPGGNPIMAADLMARAKASNQDIEAGRVHNLEEVMKEDWD